jgi:hypothetical protein
METNNEISGEKKYIPLFDHCCDKCDNREYIGYPIGKCLKENCPCHTLPTSGQEWEKQVKDVVNDMVGEAEGVSYDLYGFGDEGWKPLLDLVDSLLAKERKLDEETKKWYYERGYKDGEAEGVRKAYEAVLMVITNSPEITIEELKSQFLNSKQQ